MSKQIDINIQESESTLRNLVNQQTKLLQYQRVKALLLIKQGKVSYTYELAKKLKRKRKTIYNWLKLYQQEGIVSYLKIKIRGWREEKISKDVQQSISEKLLAFTTTLTSYVELLDWVNTHYTLSINYKTLYSHCRTHHKSVLKVARKSHHKKMIRLLMPLKKLSNLLSEIRIGLDKDKYTSVNLLKALCKVLKVKLPRTKYRKWSRRYLDYSKMRRKALKKRKGLTRSLLLLLNKIMVSLIYLKSSIPGY